ncbi:hypothetical protein DNTS_008635 [Danionella cerebrum]|uniref:Ig-like domain-containing protein n=1 Tax=Danionella cerebrum TaxID=2873325 RepID=A0A553P906_9TELE|nr:hypothetical protein DNTS_008635 [Danionella translucida]
MSEREKNVEKLNKSGLICSSGGSQQEVVEGGSVILKSGFAELKDADLIRWRFGETLIAETDAKTNRFSVFEDVFDGRFRDRLKLDQTGSLTIRNTTVDHGGLYFLQTRDGNDTVPLKVRGWRRRVVVKRRDSVALSSGRTEIMKDEKIRWRHGGETIAEIDKERNLFNVHEDVLDRRLRNRLKLDHKTGTLTITDFRSDHGGEYSVSSDYFIVGFSLSVSDEMSVIEGQSVYLSCGLNELKDEDLIRWRFGDEETLIAETDAKTNRFSVFEDVLDGRFRDRLKLDQTGSLTISDLTVDHGGLYLLQTRDRNDTVPLRVDGWRRVEVKRRNSVSLSSGRTEIMKDERIRWRYEGETIAEIDKERNLFTDHEDVLDGRLRNRLKLDHKTGTLTITDSRSEHGGWFSVWSDYFSVGFLLYVYEERSVIEGESISRSPGTDGGWIRWEFGDEEIAGFKGSRSSADIFEDVLDGRFSDRLKLNSKTGTLTISNIRAEHAGNYRCFQRSGSPRFFHVSVYARPVPVVTRDCSSSSEQICSLLCSVNVSAATLSWFRGNTLISSINESELSIALSLPLEDQENISYSCELNSMVQTQHLNVSQQCEPCADPVHCCSPTEAIIRLVLAALVGVATVLLMVYYVRSRRTERGRSHVRDYQT